MILVLASASSIRRDMLQAAGVAFEVRPGGLGRWEATAVTVVRPGDGGFSAGSP